MGSRGGGGMSRTPHTPIHITHNYTYIHMYRAHSTSTTPIHITHTNSHSRTPIHIRAHLSISRTNLSISCTPRIPHTHLSTLHTHNYPHRAHLSTSHTHTYPYHAHAYIIHTHTHTGYPASLASWCKQVRYRIYTCSRHAALPQTIHSQISPDLPHAILRRANHDACLGHFPAFCWHLPTRLTLV